MLRFNNRDITSWVGQSFLIAGIAVVIAALIGYYLNQDLNNQLNQQLSSLQGQVDSNILNNVSSALTRSMQTTRILLYIGIGLAGAGLSLIVVSKFLSKEGGIPYSWKTTFYTVTALLLLGIALIVLKSTKIHSMYRSQIAKSISDNSASFPNENYIQMQDIVSEARLKMLKIVLSTGGGALLLSLPFFCLGSHSASADEQGHQEDIHHRFRNRIRELILQEEPPAAAPAA